MTDTEIGAALGVLALPIERHDSPASVSISRLNQIALVLEHRHTITSATRGDRDPFVPQPSRPRPPPAHLGLETLRRSSRFPGNRLITPPVVRDEWLNG